MELSDIVIKKQALSISSDWEPPKFSVTIQDAESGLYGINVRRYIDADRAGFCGYVTENLYSDLDQVTASKLAKKLNYFAEHKP